MGKVLLAAMIVALGVTWMRPASAVAQAVTNKLDSGSNEGLPPIECPLRKAGIDPTKLKPFEEVEKYIQFLERADRAQWQKPDEVVKVLGLKGTEVVVDLGAGPGYFTFRLAKALPERSCHRHRQSTRDGSACPPKGAERGHSQRPGPSCQVGR